MSDGARPDRLQLQVPAQAAALSTVRLFVAASARVAGAPEEVVEDLKLAVSEAASAAILAASGQELQIDIDVTPGEVTLSVRPLTPENLTGEGLHPGDVIAALFSSARLDEATATLVIPVALEPQR